MCGILEESRPGGVRNTRGKLPRITQAVENQRFTRSGQFEKWEALEGPNRPAEAADGPEKGRLAC